MMFKDGAALYSYEVARESGENVMYVNYLGAEIVPSVADFAEVMGRTIDVLREESNVARIVFVQQRNYSYDFASVKMLTGVAGLVTFLTKQERIVSPERLSVLGEDYEEAYVFLNRIVNELLSIDPILAYRELRGKLFRLKAKKVEGQQRAEYVRLLEKILGWFDDLELVRNLKGFFDSYQSGDRAIYTEVFRADIMPNFTFTRMVAKIPGECLFYVHGLREVWIYLKLMLFLCS